MTFSEAQKKGTWPVSRSETLRNGMKKTTILTSQYDGVVKYTSSTGEAIPRLTREAFLKEKHGYNDWQIHTEA